MTKWKWIFAGVFVCSLVLFFAPLPAGPGGRWGLDKIVHALIFAVLLASGFFAFPKTKLKIFWLLFTYASIIELLQNSVFTYRSFDLIDMAAGWAGLVVSFLITRSFTSRYVKNSN